MSLAPESPTITFLVRIYMHDGRAYAVGPGVEDAHGRVDPQPVEGELAALYQVAGGFLPWIAATKQSLDDAKGSITGLRGRAFVVTELDSRTGLPLET